MNGPEHYAEAEALAASLGPDAADNAIRLAHAQVHATLALAAALLAPSESSTGGEDRG